MSILQKKITRAFFIFLFAWCPLLLVWYTQGHNRNTQSNLLGLHLPLLSLSTTSGTPFYFSYPGKKHILIFFTVECAHCLNELSHYQLLYPSFKSEVPIIAISLSNSMKTTSFLSSNNTSFPTFLGQRKLLDDSLQITDVPTLLFIDDQQIIRHAYSGERLLEEDRKLLSEFTQEIRIKKN
jgi:peroxiredoxin